MRELALDPVVLRVLGASLSLLFAAAAVHKLRDLSGFRAALRGYRLLPEPTLGAAVGSLVACESLVAVALWVPAWNAAAALMGALLLALYSAAVAINLLRGRRDIDCGCLGPAARQPLSKSLVLRNALLGAAALALLLPATARPWHWVDGLTVLGGVATLAAIFAASNQLLALSSGHLHSHLQSQSHRRSSG